MSAEAEARCFRGDEVSEISAFMKRRQREKDTYALQEFDRINPQAIALRAKIAPEVAKLLENECAVEIGQQLLALIAKAETEQRVHSALMGKSGKLTLPAHLQSPERTPAIASSWDNATAVEQFAVQVWRRIAQTKAGFEYHGPRSEADAVRNGEMPTGGDL